MHLDVGWLGLSVGIAVRNSTHTSLGASFGVGGNWANYMVIAGRHFSESGGPSYEPKDGATAKELLELFRASLFMRRHFAHGRQLDIGVKGSGFLHSDSSDDDPGGGAFVGLSISPLWWQWRRLRVGSELGAGGYFESGGSEFGLNAAPIFARITFP